MHDPFEPMRRLSSDIAKAYQPILQNRENILRAVESWNKLLDSALPQIIEEQNKMREIMTSTLDQIPKFNELIPKYQWEHSIKSINQIQESLSSLALPRLQQHMKFMASVIKGIDFESLSQYIPETKQIQEEEVEEKDEEVHITRPQYFHTATKLVIVVNVVDDRIEQANVDKETTEKWKKVVKPVIEVLIAILLGWAVSNVPLNEMNIVKAFQNIVETISDYDLNVGIVEDDSLNKTHEIEEKK